MNTSRKEPDGGKKSNSPRCRIKRRIRARIREESGGEKKPLEIRLQELNSGTWEARIFLRNNNESETAPLHRFQSQEARDAARQAIRWLQNQFAAVNFESSRSE